MSMTARDLNIAIKRGVTESELLLEYDCTHDEFDNHMASLYPNERTRQRKKRDLASNKRIHRRATSSAEELPAGIPVEEPVSTTESEETTPVAAESEEVTPVTKPEEVTTVGSLLEAIVLQQEKISQQIAQKKEDLNQFELLHKGYAQARTDIRSILRDYREKVSRLHTEYLSMLKKVEEKAAEMNDYAAKMVELNGPIATIRDEISGLEAELNAGSAEIFAFDSGEIQFNDTKITEFDGWEALYHELRSRDDWDDRLSFLQLKQLAKLIVTIQQLETSGIRFDIMFDSEILEDAYHQSRS